MLWKSNRADSIEMMGRDPIFYTDEEYDESLRKVGDIGRIFGGYSATLKAFMTLPKQPTSILDVGCGGGSFTMLLAEHFQQARVVGIDSAPEAIVAARTYHVAYEKVIGEELPFLSFQTRQSKVFSEPEKSFDVVTATFLCQQLKNDDVIDFLRAAYATARHAVIINDLHRNLFAYSAFWCISPFLYNRIIRRDGLLAIRRSFVRSDWERCLTAAGIDIAACTITWRWAFGWIVTISVL